MCVTYTLNSTGSCRSALVNPLRYEYNHDDCTTPLVRMFVRQALVAMRSVSSGVARIFKLQSEKGGGQGNFSGPSLSAADNFPVETTVTGVP